ncbi:uncharacterized protein MYCFIDRAFT_176683 [Pseudocercospora fijiensis CIRAD86]|uniref:Major facilitator superfamily (MFS) profile domain-containing protein n=1 Tax=Pseudocercospora fijiensis (strain CIRAD86) TaxID=383855 RepID=M2YUJ3_PSEFD|nr:uncharacterized protein MYCFIDRAFT_176683 [Pseudocercospora fijiensis CIRAD86]EME81405.1 hypothetical protein MYCFIDRAFT_176683 [Pseudocercospora fijiensis CIRAD86]
MRHSTIGPARVLCHMAFFMNIYIYILHLQHRTTVQDTGRLPHVDASTAEEAAKATASETSMTLLQGLKTYPKAVGWSILLSTCIIMEGFDLVLICSDTIS